ncbi:hypothetical protein BKA65DRAFT_544407 [Rhexocercosporidium sp. MPI-PUGE-AT-0058]|nr:hypothetical protein BKA65DRAFT_544407 [Rhexocercosporidium sp. MPI-PUGE-AT-0058]
MEFLNPSKTIYHPVRNYDNDADSSSSSLSVSGADPNEHLIPEKDTLCTHATLSSRQHSLRKYLPFLLHLLLIAIYTTAFIYQPAKVVIREGFDAPTDAPIEYETVKYFGEPGGSIYFGPSNNETDAAWEGLLTNGPGIVWISEDAASRLSEPTERVRDYNREINPDVPGYMGNIEVFHQLHCLNRIRKLFYNQTREDVHDEIPEMREPHTTHCFEYLRQVLQCHGDVGIMSLGWDAEGEAYTAIFETERQCRNFEMIREWTKEHQVLTFLPTNRINASDFEDGR